MSAAPLGDLSRELVAELYDEVRRTGGVSRSDELRGHNLGRLQLADVVVERLDLSSCQLAGSNLSRATLLGVDLAGADLRGVDLTGVRLTGVGMASVDLSRADLRDAFLDGCDLRDAVLTDAVMSGAQLSSTLLARADLRGADLSSAGLRECTLTQADLDGALLHRTKVVDCITRGVRLGGARAFHTTRALIVEALLQAADGDVERLGLVSVVRERSDVCWGQVHDLVDADPFVRAWVTQVFEQYPASGMLEAFRQGSSDGASRGGE